jgi:GGDEF domain-containing protein
VAIINVDHFKSINDTSGHAAGDRLLQNLAGGWQSGSGNAGHKGVTCSSGAAPWQAGDSMSLLLGRADSALYEAKRLGRDRIAWTAAT